MHVHEHDLWLGAFAIIIASVGLAWGMLALLSPKRWVELSSVDWMPISFDAANRSQRMQLRFAGAVVTLLAALLLYLLFTGFVVSAHHAME